MDLFATVFFLETKGSWWFVVFSQTSLNILGTGFRGNGLWSFSVPISFSISLGINVTSAFCSFPLWLWKSHQVGGYWDKSCSTVTVITLPEMKKPRLRKVKGFPPITQVISSESSFHPTQSSHSSSLSYKTP